MTIASILLVEPDAAMRYILGTVIKDRLHATLLQATSAHSALTMLNGPDAPSYQLILVSAESPDGKELEVVRRAASKYPDTPIVMIASSRSMKLAQKAIEEGATDYIQKDDSAARITETLQSLIQGRTSLAPKEKTGQQPSPEGFRALIGTSNHLTHAIQQAKQAAESDIPVLLHGESGVGKERFAQSIHQHSPRKRRPFIAVNCGAIPETLVESTLFGHVKGAFTGATSDAPGKFREADGGTLFLDEIGELPLSAQVKLLRALQEQTITPVGGEGEITINVRVISASHVNLSDAIQNGTFREDLYYRLNVFPVQIPALRERGKNDIRALTDYFTQKFAEREHKNISGLTDDAYALLENYDWPGNIRQLENTLFRAVVLAKSDQLDASVFTGISNALQQRQRDQAQQAVSHIPKIHTQRREELSVSAISPTGDFRALEEVEADVIRAAMKHYRWHITDIARDLGITRATLYRKLSKYGITDPRDTTP